MPLSSVFERTEHLLEQVLRTIREEYEGPFPVLSETDRNMYVEEEEDLRKRLKETMESELSSLQWRNLIGLPSPRAAKCLKDAEELRQRVAEDISGKVRTKLMGRSRPPSARHDQGSASNLMDASTPEANTGLPRMDPNPEPASSIITSPLNMRCSVPEISELIVYPKVQNDTDFSLYLNEAINTPLQMSSDRSPRSSSRRQSRPPSLLSPPRRTVQSGNSRILSGTTSSLGSSSAPRPRSIRRPVTPTPQSSRQSQIPGSPINGSSSHGPSSPNPMLMSSITELTEQLASIITESLSGQAPGQRNLGHHISRTNHVDFHNSDVEGFTLNNGGSYNSGAVVHKTTLPQRVSQA